MYAFRIILLWNYYTILVYLTKGGGGVHLGFKKPSFLAPKLKNIFLLKNKKNQAEKPSHIDKQGNSE